MSANPTATRESLGCNRLAPPLAPLQPECVHAGGDSEPLLAPLQGGATSKFTLGCTPALAPPESPISTRLTLTLDQTAEIVRQAGGESHLGRVFAVVSPGSYPTSHGRLVLNFIECDTMHLANDAVAVAQGKARAVRIKRATSDPDAIAEASTPPASRK